MSRLVIVDRSRLRIVDLERNDGVDLSARGDIRLANRQPAWSTDGGRVAWSAFDRRQPDSPASLVVGAPEGTWRLDHPAVFAPFYLAWRPDGEAIAALADGPLGLELSVNSATTGTCEIVHRATPLFFAWSSAGALAVHGGDDTAARLDVSGDRYNSEAFAKIVTGSFTAPAFVQAGLVLAVIEHEGTMVLATLDREAAVQRVIASTEFGARFTVDVTGTWVAYTSGQAAPGPLVAHHLPTDSLTFVDERPPALFVWSPDGNRLLFARVAERGDFPTLEWCTWEAGEIRVHARARTTATFGREVLPFHEQYTRSHTWWSPDSDAFCFAAVDDYGNDAIWVMHLHRSAPTRVATGSLAVWSPT